jgi:alpha-beta hydrolase superfamily lysophospholipase
MVEIKKISFITSDGVKIFANYYPNKESKFAGILIHMRPKTKESFDDFAKFLQEKGFTLLAIDLRGHGESIESPSGILDYTKFTEEEEKKSIKDVEAASNFLEKEGFTKERQFLIGASIGANLAYEFLTENESIKAVVLLSPGYNYRGLILDNFYKKDLDSKILVISSKDDQEMALKGFEWFKEKHPSSTLIMLEKGGHGTTYFDTHPQVKEIIYNFLLERLSF